MYLAFLRGIDNQADLRITGLDKSSDGLRRWLRAQSRLKSGYECLIPTCNVGDILLRFAGLFAHARQRRSHHALWSGLSPQVPYSRAASKDSLLNTSKILELRGTASFHDGHLASR